VIELVERGGEFTDQDTQARPTCALSSVLSEEDSSKLIPSGTN
jgi:hypothetical protein